MPGFDPALHGPQQAFQQALVLHRQGQVEQAQQIYQAILQQHPLHFDSLHLLGLVALQTGRGPRALELIRQAIQVRPDVAAAHVSLGSALQGVGRPDEALAAYDQALRLDPRHAEACNNRGNVLRGLGRPQQALASYDQAVALQPDYTQAHYNRALVLKDLQRLDEALLSSDRALALAPDLAEAWNNRGTVLRAQRRLDDALASYEQALAIRPDEPGFHDNRGAVLQELGRHDEALASHDRALAIQPMLANAHHHRGLALRALRRLDEALASCDAALAIQADAAEAWRGRGHVLLDLQRPAEALRSYDQALSLAPDHAQAWHDRGLVLLPLQRPADALASLDRALALQPDLDFLLGARLHAKASLCDWSDHASQMAGYAQGIAGARPVTAPFIALALLDAPELHKTAASVYADTLFRRRPTLGPAVARPTDGKIRLGYYSADFHDHATMWLIAEMLESHDRDRFELHAFSFGPDRRDALRQRATRAFDSFTDVRHLGDRDVASLSRARGIDVAVDLKGYTRDARAGVFHERCAPLQVSYLGYPGTLGSKAIDYIFADEIVIPRSQQTDFTEQVVYLPTSYFVNDSTRPVARRSFTRVELGLPEQGFVFCCFNGHHKIQPETFDRWMRILRAVEGSVLWLLQGDPAATTNLVREAQARGVDGRRLVFAPRMRMDEHLARHRQAGLFLDTLPYNAHTTACDALWAGLPVLTCMGRSFASRVGGSLLHALGLTDLVASDVQAYESLAIELALSPERLSRLRGQLDTARRTRALFDGRIFVRHLESAFHSMVARQRAGLPPAGFEVMP